MAGSINPSMILSFQSIPYRKIRSKEDKSLLTKAIQWADQGKRPSSPGRRTRFLPCKGNKEWSNMAQQDEEEAETRTFPPLKEQRSLFSAHTSLP